MNATELEFLSYVAEGEVHFAGMGTGRTFRKATAEALVVRGLLEKFDAVVCDGDGFTLEPERWRAAYKLTDAGVVELRAHAPERFAAIVQRPELHAAKRERWLSAGVPRCCGCGCLLVGDERIPAADPYAADINGDETLVLQCDSCASDSADEI